MALQEDGGPAPYAPATAMVQVIRHYREKGIAAPIDATKLERVGVENSLTRRTVAAMKQLDLLTDDGNPSPTLDRIKTAPSDQLQSVLADWLRAAYKPIFQYVDATDDVVKVSDQFRHYVPDGMRNRMVTLFLGLCAEAGLIDAVPPLPRKNAKPATPNGKKLKPVGTGKPKPPKLTPSVDTSTIDARQRYIDLLIAKAEAQDEPDQGLLDRIERALGIPSGGGT